MKHGIGRGLLAGRLFVTAWSVAGSLRSGGIALGTCPACLLLVAPLVFPEFFVLLALEFCLLDDRVHGRASFQ